MRFGIVHVVLVRQTMRLLKQTPFVLLLLTICSIVFVIIFELAVSHIRNKKEQESLSSNKKVEPVRLEAVFDHKAPNVDVNIQLFRHYTNIVRIRKLLQIMKEETGPWSVNRTLDRRKENEENATEVRLCPEVPSGLVGRMKVDVKTSIGRDMEFIKGMNPKVQPGGIYSPDDCISRYRVAVVIPYRDRIDHLANLLYYLHPILQRQLLHYKIYVVEQYGNDTFNKGVLMNAGVKEALREIDFHCFVFHDVDLVPEDDRNMYSCPPTPRHLSVAVDKFNYTLPYGLLVGGVFAIKTEHLLKINGYSNLYWGWGGEDDDMAYRITHNKLNLIRPPDNLARYTMIKHDHRAESPSNVRYALLRMAKKRSPKDGLNTVKYSIVAKTSLPLYTHVLVNIGTNHRWQFDGEKRLVVHF